MMQLDPSVGQDDDSEAAQLTQPIRSRGGGAARFTSTRPTYARPLQSVDTRAPVSNRMVFPTDRSLPDNTATSIEMRPGDRMVGPDEVALGASDQGPSMAAAYQKLLHSVALQHGGQPPSEGSLASPSGSAGPPLSPAESGPASWQGMSPEEKAARFERERPQQRTADRASDGVGQTPAQRERSEATAPPDREKTTPGLPSPPKLPANASKEELAQFKQDHQAWADELKFHSVHNTVMGGGHNNAQHRLEMAAVKAQHTVAEKDLEDAKSELEKNRGWGIKAPDAKYTKAVSAAQSRLDRVKTRRDKLMEDILGKEEESGTSDSGELESGIPTITDEDAWQALEPGTRYIDPEGNHRTKS